MGRYDDIINLPHRQSEKREHMSIHDRAAQFSPFAALTGHSDAIEETARLTDGRIILGEYEANLLDEKLRQLIENPNQIVKVTYFVPDGKKQGGKYVTESKAVRLVDETLQTIIFKDKSEIDLRDVADIELPAKGKKGKGRGKKERENGGKHVEIICESGMKFIRRSKDGSHMSS